MRARGHEHLPPVSGPYRVFLPRLPCRASARRRSLGAKIPRKLSAHRCFAVCAEQIWAGARRSPQGILLYCQGLERSPGPNMPAQTGRGSCSLALWIERTAFACLKGSLAPSPRMVVHSVHFSAPWVVVGDRGRSQAKIKTDALFLCHSEPVRTPVRNLSFRGKISHQPAGWFEMTGGGDFPCRGRACPARRRKHPPRSRRTG